MYAQLEITDVLPYWNKEINTTLKKFP